MSLETWNTVASVGTFVVIAATAIAAIAQLLHMRRSNQISAITKFWEILNSERILAARRWMVETFPTVLASADGRARLGAAFLPRDLEPMRDIANVMELMGTMVRLRIIDADLVVGEFDGLVLQTWKRLEPAVLIRREVTVPGLWGGFEYLATLSERSMRETGGDRYPKGWPRMSVDARSAEALDAFIRERAKAGEESTDGRP